MRKKLFKKVIDCVILLFFVSNLQAQKYTVLEIHGTVKMSSNDGKSWNLLKENDELKANNLIKLFENSNIHFTDSIWVYSYSDTIIVSVNDIIKQKKSTLTEVVRSLGRRTDMGAVYYQEPKTQYKVFLVGGTVKKSIDNGKNWNLVKNNDELEANYKIKVIGNSYIYIISYDFNSILVKYSDSKTASVCDIFKQRKISIEDFFDSFGKNTEITENDSVSEPRYKVFLVEGFVGMSIDNGETWKLLKDNDELKADYKIKLLENSFIHITDSKLVYSYSDTITVSVLDILKRGQRNTIEEIKKEVEIRKAYIEKIYKEAYKKANKEIESSDD